MSESSPESTENQYINQSSAYGQKIYRPEINHIVDQRYKLLRKIGEGGMGYVYLAEQLNISRKVVIKLLKPEFCVNDEQLGRFKREAELASKLSHPNCVTIHDFGFHERAPYIVMEYLEGQALSELIFYKKEYFSIAEVSHYIGQVCDALEVAQDLGVVHRDLKPENIFVLEEPLGGLDIKVLDFGIAKLAHNHPEASSSNLTRGDMVFGTPQYMAPEQIRGKPLDHRADVYALTVILYEMLSGKVPYEQNDPSDLVSILTQHLRDPVPELIPEKLHPEAAAFCGALNQIIQAGMAKKPEDRLSTTQELKLRLTKLVEIGLSENEPPKRPTADTLPTPNQDALVHDGEGRVKTDGNTESELIEPSLTGDETIGMAASDLLTHDSELQKTLPTSEKKSSFSGFILKFAFFTTLLVILLAFALTHPKSPLKQDTWQARLSQLPIQVQNTLNVFENKVSPHMFRLYKALNILGPASDKNSSISSAKLEVNRSEQSIIGSLNVSGGDHKQTTKRLKVNSKQTTNDVDQVEVSHQAATVQKVSADQQRLDEGTTKLIGNSPKPKSTLDTQSIAVIVFESNQDCKLSINQKKTYAIKKGTKKRIPVRFGRYTLNCVNQAQQSCERRLGIEERKKYLSTCTF